MTTLYGCSTHQFESRGKIGLQLHVNGSYNCNLTIRETEDEGTEDGSRTA
jgi:hypothetical protein